MDHPVIERFKALDQRFVERAKRGDRLTARFAALTCLNARLSPSDIVDRSFESRDALNHALGNWRAPSRSMRLVFAAALVSAERNVENFLEARAALQERRRTRGSRSLSHGGACAALALVAAGGQPHQADQFYDTLNAIAGPWWRRDAHREEVVAGALTGMGDMPDEAVGRLIEARQALRDAHIPPSAADPAAYELALQAEMRSGDVASAWITLNTAVRGRSALKHGIGRTGLAILSAEGDGQRAADALVRSFEALREIRPRVSSDVAARIALRLAQAQLGRQPSLGPASDLAAIISAQMAMIAAVTAASSATVVAVAS